MDLMPQCRQAFCSMDNAQTTEALVASLISLLEAGTSPWRREWDARSSGHHANLRSGRRYRGVNPVLLALGMHLRGSVLPYWCGWGEAKALGLSPRQGSRAVHVLQPLVHRRAVSSVQSRDQDNDANGTWISFRPVPLFNAADLVGSALPGLLQQRAAAANARIRPEPERLAAAEAVLQRWPVPMNHGGSQACYCPQADCIVLPERRAFHSAEAFYATWAHEVIHSTGHVTRLNRDLSGSFGSPSYAREELVAELGSVLLGDRLEIGSDLANHAAYLASWVTLLQESPRLLLQVLGDVRRAVDLIVPEVPPTADLRAHGASDQEAPGQSTREPEQEGT